MALVGAGTDQLKAHGPERPMVFPQLHPRFQPKRRKPAPICFARGGIDKGLPKAKPPMGIVNRKLADIIVLFLRDAEKAGNWPGVLQDQKQIFD